MGGQMVMPEGSDTDINALPDGVLSDILSRIHDERGQEVLYCMEVCKRWRAVIQSFVVTRLHLKDFKQQRISRYGYRGTVLFLLVKQLTRFEGLSSLKIDNCALEDWGSWHIAFESLGSTCRHMSALHLVNVEPELDVLDTNALVTHLPNLHTLELTSCIRHFPNNPTLLSHMPSLSHLLLDHNLHLRSLPCLAPLTRLRTLSLVNTVALTFAPGISTLTNLRSLLLAGSNLELPPSLAHLSTLTSLSLSLCDNPNTPNTNGNGNHPQKIASYTPPTIESLALSSHRSSPLPHLPALHTFTFQNSLATDFPRFPGGAFADLKTLEIIGCHSIQMIAAVPAPSLRTLRVENCDALLSLQPFKAPQLQTLLVKACKQLQYLVQPTSTSDCAASKLQILNVDECPHLVALPDPESLADLRSLTVRASYNVAVPEHLSPLAKVTHLHLSGGGKVPSSFTSLTALETLKLEYVALERLPDMRALSHVRTLELTWVGLQDLGPVSGLPVLSKLQVSNCHRLESLPPSLATLERLEMLIVSVCEGLTSVPALDGLAASLLVLDLHGCPKLERVPDLGALTALCALNLSNCKALRQLPVLDGLRQLRFVDLSGCPGLVPLVPKTWKQKMPFLLALPCDPAKPLAH